jgi:hypothetical protein
MMVVDEGLAKSEIQINGSSSTLSRGQPCLPSTICWWCIVDGIGERCDFVVTCSFSSLARASRRSLSSYAAHMATSRTTYLNADGVMTSSPMPRSPTERHSKRHQTRRYILVFHPNLCPQCPSTSSHHPTSKPARRKATESLQPKTQKHTHQYSHPNPEHHPEGKGSHFAFLATSLRAAANSIFPAIAFAFPFSASPPPLPPIVDDDDDDGVFTVFALLGLTESLHLTANPNDRSSIFAFLLASLSLASLSPTPQRERKVDFPARLQPSAPASAPARQTTRNGACFGGTRNTRPKKEGSPKNPQIEREKEPKALEQRQP